MTIRRPIYVCFLTLVLVLGGQDSQSSVTVSSESIHTGQTQTTIQTRAQDATEDSNSNPTDLVELPQAKVIESNDRRLTPVKAE